MRVNIPYMDPMGYGMFLETSGKMMEHCINFYIVFCSIRMWKLAWLPQTNIPVQVPLAEKSKLPDIYL